MTSYADRLNECYKKALGEDLNLAVKIADKLKGVAPADVPDERIQKFIEELDDMVHFAEVDTIGQISPYRFEYGGQNFEVKII